MEFLRARTKEQISNRQQEIISACCTLYEQNGYDGVNFKAISELTSFTRPSIYNYYKTKDEVLLDLLGQEIAKFQENLIALAVQPKQLSKQEFATVLTEILSQHDRMLRLWSILFTVLEHNCRVEKLAEFKQSVITILGTISEVMRRNFVNAKNEQIEQFVSALLAYVLGLYPMSHMTEKQKQAVLIAGIQYEAPDFKELCASGIYQLLSNI